MHKFFEYRVTERIYNLTFCMRFRCMPSCCHLFYSYTAWLIHHFQVKEIVPFFLIIRWFLISKPSLSSCFLYHHLFIFSFLIYISVTINYVSILELNGYKECLGHLSQVLLVFEFTFFC